MKKLISILLVFTLLISSSFSAFAIEKNFFGENTWLKIYDEAIEDYITIKLIDVNDIEIRSQGIDSNNNVIYDYTYNAEENYIYDNITKEKTVFTDNMIKKISNLELMNISSDMEIYATSGDPNYCTYPDPLEFGISLKVIYNAGLASAAALAVWLAPVLAAQLGVSASVIKDAALFSFGVVAGDIWGGITSGEISGKDANFKAYYTCEYMCTWDDGEVCFYGDQLDEVEYLGVY